MGSIDFAQILCAGKFSVKHLLLTSSHGRCGDCLELQFSIVRRTPFFAERRKREDFTVFDWLMRRKRGDAPPPEDTIE